MEEPVRCVIAALPLRRFNMCRCRVSDLIQGSRPSVKRRRFCCLLRLPLRPDPGIVSYTSTAPYGSHYNQIQSVCQSKCSISIHVSIHVMSSQSLCDLCVMFSVFSGSSFWCSIAFSAQPQGQSTITGMGADWVKNSPQCAHMKIMKV